MERCKELLALLLIDRVPEFRNSYQLKKVLSWKFNFFEFVDIIQALIGEELITEKVINQMGYYETTDTGRVYLERNKEALFSFLVKTYPDEREFFENIFRRTA